MKISRKLNWMLLACAALFTWSACIDDDSDALPYDAFVISPTGEMNFAYEVFEDKLQITANIDWNVTVEPAAEWLHLDVKGGLITVKVDPNETSSERKTNLVFTRNGQEPISYPVICKPIIREKDEISIITVNVKDGFAGRQAENTVPNNSAVLSRFKAFVKTYNPDVICYQELKGYTSESFAGLAASSEINHEYTAFFAVSSGYSIGISSRYPITNTETFQSGMTHGLLMATCCNVGLGVTQLNEDATHDKRMLESESIISSMSAYTQKWKTLDGTLILGDMHALSSYDKGSEGYPTDDSSYAVINSYNQNNYWGYYQLLKTAKGENTTNPNSTKYSANSFRYDHILASKGLQDAGLSYGVLTESPLPLMSDHFPVKATIKVTKFK